jgi:hypothetical protein
LEEVRKTIQEILVFNAQGSIEMTPDFIEQCMQVYCPTDKECFKMGQLNTKSEVIPSVLFQAIYDHYYSPSPQNTTPTPTPKSKKDFYNELMVNLFCVFNVTKFANNPPVVPYIDTNSLKQNFYNRLYKKEQSYKEKLTTDLKKVLRNIAKYPNKLKELNDSPIIKKLASKYLGLEFPVNKTPEDAPKKSPYSSILTVNEYQKVQDADNKNANEPPADKVNLGIFEKDMNEMLILIDKTNAASVIGTLEFMDVMSKFGTTENLCTLNDLSTLYQGTNGVSEDYFKTMKQFHQLHEISNSEYDDVANLPNSNFFQLLSDHYKYEMETNTWIRPQPQPRPGGGKKNKTEKKRVSKHREKTEKNRSK